MGKSKSDGLVWRGYHFEDPEPEIPTPKANRPPGIRKDPEPKRKPKKRVHKAINSRTKIMNVRVPLDLYDKLQQGAQTAGCTMTDIVVAALTVALLRDEPTDTEEGGTEDA